MIKLANRFETISLGELDVMNKELLDALTFGVVGFTPDTIVEIYNASEARLAGLNPANVIGAPFFTAIAQCMNNFMVAQKFKDESELDEIVPYVLTLRMRPTKVRLRLLAATDVPRHYILIER